MKNKTKKKPKKGEFLMIKTEKEKNKDMNKGITLIALVITIVLNFSYLEMARMNRFEKI